MKKFLILYLFCILSSISFITRQLSANQGRNWPSIALVKDCLYSEQYDLAILIGTELCAIEPDNAEAFAILGSAYYLYGDKHKAKAVWYQALKKGWNGNNLLKLLERLEQETKLEIVEPKSPWQKYKTTTSTGCPDSKRLYVFDFVGVGISLDPENQGTILEVFENSPAFEAGLRAGDRIVQIDERDVTNLTSIEIAALIRGRIGTEVKLKIISKETGIERWVRLVRRRISIPKEIRPLPVP